MPSAIFWAKFLKNSSASSGRKWSYELSHARRILDCFQLAIIRREIFSRLLWKAITLNILFTRRYVLAMSNGIDEPGAIRAPLAASLLLAWSAVFCCLYKGIKSFSKVCFRFSPFIAKPILCWILSNPCKETFVLESESGFDLAGLLQ